MHGFLKAACQKAALWGEKRFPDGKFEVLEAPGKTPCLFFDIPALGNTSEQTAFFYGHLDKQPEAAGWTKIAPPSNPSSKTAVSTGAAVPTTATASTRHSLPSKPWKKRD